MKYQSHVCPNGLTALAAPQRELPLISLQVWVETGSAHEAEYSGAGISHLLEHMVFKGTAEFSGQELNERVPALGGLWNAYTSTDRTVYHIDGPAEHWREFLHLLVQLTLHPCFPEDEFECERDVIRREMAMYDDDPQDAAYHALIGTLYRREPRRLPVIGSRAAFDALTHADMVTYHRRRYVPANMFICAAGDIDEEDFFRAVEEETRDIPARAASPVPAVTEPRQWGKRLHREEFAQPTSTLMLGWRIPASDHADAAPLMLLASILGDGRASWLYRRFHEETGMVHDVNVVTMPSRTGEGAIVIEFDVERDRRDAARDALLDFMAELPNADFAEARKRARKQMLTARLRTLSTVQGLAGTLAMAWHLTRNGNSHEEWDAALDRVTDADLQRVARTYFTAERLTEVSIDPKGTNADEAVADRRTTPPAEGKSSEEFTLPNGLRVVTRIDRRVPMVFATLVFGAGSRTETEKTAGLNSLLCEMMLKGTTTRSAAELADAVENLGGGISSSAGNNTFSLRIRGLSQDTEALLELLADAALHPTFPEDALETEKEAMIADILDTEEDPAALAFRRLRRLCFGSVSYGNHRDGTVESIRSLDRADVVNQHARIVCAQNAVLAVAGDISPATVQELAGRLFAEMPAGLPAAMVTTPAQQAGDEHVPADKEQTVIALALPACTATGNDIPLQLLFEEWCRDMAGPIFSELREARGLAYYAAASSLLGTDTGCLYFYLGTASDRAEEARAALEEVLEKLVKEGMPAEALERSRATALSGRLLTLQSCAKRCEGMAVNTLLGLSADYDDTVPELLRDVTTEAMNAFIARTLAPTGTRTWVTVGPTDEE